MASRDLSLLDPRLRDIWLDVQKEHRRERPEVTLLVTATFRAPDEQFALYKIGRRQLADGSWVPDDDAATTIVTQLDGVHRKSKHNVQPACALDFAVIVGGKITWALTEYEFVAQRAEHRGLVWGGRWKTFVDGPHLEIPD